MYMPRFPQVPITQQEIEDARKQLSNEVRGRKGLYPLIKKHGKKILEIEKKYSSNEEERDELEIDLEEPIREKRKNKHLTDEQIREKIQSFNEILQNYKNDIEKEEETIKTFYKKLPKFETKLNLDELDDLLIKFNLVMTQDPDSLGEVPIYRKLYEFRNPSFEIYFDEEEGELPEDVVERMTPISRSEYESNARLGQPGNPDDYNYVDYSGGAKKSRKKRKSRKSKKVKKTHKSKKMHKTKKGQRGQRGQKRKTRKQK
jgi:hypothetical protein